MHLRILNHPANWDAGPTDRQHEIASLRWQDPRPWTILLGDSHIEMGNCYDFFYGAKIGSQLWSDDGGYQGCIARRTGH